MYPVMIDFKGKNCTIVGGGRAALRKAKGMHSDGAVIRVVAPEVCAPLADMAHEVIYSEYSAESLKNSFAVAAATNDEEVNRKVLEDCRSMGILCMSVQGGGDFQMCSAADCGGVTVAAHTGGEFPMLGSMLRDDMRRRYGECGALARLLGRYRREAIENGQRELIPKMAELLYYGISAEELEEKLKTLVHGG